MGAEIKNHEVIKNMIMKYLIRLALFLMFIFAITADQVVASEDRYFKEEELQDFFGGPRKGGTAPEFALKALDGASVTVPDDAGGKPIVLEFGSYTCPIFRGKHKSMEDLYLKYAGKAKFYLIYTIEAHPNDNACPYKSGRWVTEPNRRLGILYEQPASENERKEIAYEARSSLNITMPILIDNMNNSVWVAYGRAPNAAYLIGADRKIKLRQGWFKPRQFEKALKGELAK